MTRRVGILLLAGMLVIVGILALRFASHWGEPAYCGRTLSSWFAQYVQYANHYSLGLSNDDSEEAFTAIQAMGTNALPWLLQEAYATEPVAPFGSNRLVWARLDRPAWVRVPRLLPRLRFCESAAEVVVQLRPPADLLVNSLRNRLQSTNAEHFRVAIHLLGGAGEGSEKVVPLLTEALHGTNSWTQYGALQSLDKIGPAAEAAISEIIEYLANPTLGSSRHLAISTLGNFGPKASAAIPEIERLMRTAPEPFTRAKAAVALCQISGNHPEALAMIRSALFEKNLTDDSGKHPRKSDMASALVGTRGYAEVVVPIVLELIEQERRGFSETWMEQTGISVLTKVAPERAMAILDGWTRNDPREYVRLSAAYQGAAAPRWAGGRFR